MSDLTKNLIKKFEGLRLTRYQDVAGVQTIGWGHTGNGLLPFITLDDAEAYLDADIATAQSGLKVLIKEQWGALPEHQKAALTSFVFNLGVGAFRNSGIRRRIMEGKPEEVPHELSKWRLAGSPKRVYLGLVRRRAFEALLWCGDAETIKALETALEGGV